MKKAAVTFTLVVLMLVYVGVSWGAGTVGIKFGDVKLQTSRTVFISNGRVMIPLRDIFEAMGASVSWEAKTKTVIAKRGKDEISLTVGSPNALWGQKNIKLDAAPVISNRSVFVPLRFVAESLGAKVTWNAKFKTASISDTITDSWLARAKKTGTPLFWKIADVNNDNKPELIVLLETKTDRKFMVFSEKKIIFSVNVKKQVNDMSIISLDGHIRGVTVFQYTPSGFKNLTVFKFASGEVSNIGNFGAGGNTVTIVSGGDGKTQIIENSGGSQNNWQFDGNALIQTPGPGTPGNPTIPFTPAIKPGEAARVRSLSHNFLDLIMSGNIEAAKLLTANPGNPNTAAVLQKSISDRNNFIGRHNGSKYTPADGSVLSSNTAQYYKWIKYKDEEGFLQVTLENVNNQWVVTDVVFNTVSKPIQ